MCKWYLLALKHTITYLINKKEPDSNLELSFKTLHRNFIPKNPGKKDLMKSFYTSWKSILTYEDRVHILDLQTTKKVENF